MNGKPIIQTLNNNILNVKNAMPLKNLTTNNEQSFEIDRKLFNKAYQPPVNFSLRQTGRSFFQRQTAGIQHGYIVDGPKTVLQKKWIGGNRDASQIAMRRRMNTTGEANQKAGPQSFNSNTDNNSRIDALSRVRGGGSRVPLKVANRPVTFSMMPPSQKYYRIISAGLEAATNINGILNNPTFSAYNISPGFYSYTPQNNMLGTPLANVALGTFIRSYNVLTIDRITGITNITKYDVFGEENGNPGYAGLTTYLNSLTPSVIVIIATYDEPKTRPGSTTLPQVLIEAVQRCGGSSDFGSKPLGILNYRSAYILVGVPYIGVGKGLQKYIGDSTSSGDLNAAIDLRISILNGNYTYISG
jgi:hypothetical protein